MNLPARKTPASTSRQFDGGAFLRVDDVRIGIPARVPHDGNQERFRSGKRADFARCGGHADRFLTNLGLREEPRPISAQRPMSAATDSRAQRALRPFWWTFGKAEPSTKGGDRRLMSQ